MKKFTLLAALWLLPLWTCLAQLSGVSVEVTLPQSLFLPNEECVAEVRVINRSGQTLTLGKESDWLTFELEAGGKPSVVRLADPKVEGEFTLPSSKTAVKRVNLTPCFDFSTVGRYQVTATVRLPAWNVSVSSKPKPFEVINGTKLMELSFGVPKKGEEKGAPEVRKYVLQQAVYLKKLRLYFRLTDETGGKTYAVFPLAPYISFSNPIAQIDRFSNFHVLHQTGARSCSYCMINPDGQILSRQTYDITSSRPALRAAPDGRIVVVGGERSPSATDLPPSEIGMTPDVHAP